MISMLQLAQKMDAFHPTQVLPEAGLPGSWTTNTACRAASWSSPSRFITSQFPLSTLKQVPDVQTQEELVCNPKCLKERELCLPVHFPANCLSADAYGVCQIPERDLLLGHFAQQVLIYCFCFRTATASLCLIYHLTCEFTITPWLDFVNIIPSLF